MELRELGHSDLRVSPVGLGTWPIGGVVETWGEVDDNESIATIQAALDAGLNLIDTAPIYGLGHSEVIVGRAIQGRRHQVVLATKCGLQFPTERGQLPKRSLRRAHILRECDESLRRLRTDTIDLYQVHWPDADTPIAETMDALNTLRKEGKIRAIGLCNFGVEQIVAAREFARIDCVQPPFSLLHLRSAEALIPYCTEHRIAVTPYGTLAKGLLAGKFTAGSTFTDIRSRDPEFIGDRFRRNLNVVAQLSRIAMRYSRTVGQLAINWVVHYPGVTAALVGAKKPSQLAENVGALGWTITAADREEIARIIRNGPAQACSTN